jgi:hypothetical protein
VSGNVTELGARLTACGLGLTLAMADLGTHAAFLASNLAPPGTLASSRHACLHQKLASLLGEYTIACNTAGQWGAALDEA